jgi:hypothetical protein
MSRTATVVLALLFSGFAGGPVPSVRSTPVPAKRMPATIVETPSAPAATVDTRNMGAVGASAASSAEAYGAIRDQLRPSGVPVLLPVPLPREIQPARSITVVAADRTGYVVGFSPETHCFEALSCSFFHVSGFTRTALADRSYLRDRPVTFNDGRRGFFRPQDCSGASCTEASLTFERFGAIYEIDVKVDHDDLRVLKCAYRNLRLVH